MKKLLLLTILLSCMHVAVAQWSTGTDIYNQNTGNVGINFTTPQARLHVNGSLIVNGNTANLDPKGSTLPNTIAQTGWMLMGWNRTGGKGEADFISNQGGGLSGGFAFFNHDNSNAETQLVTFYGNGNVGIGVPVPANKLDVNGTVHAKSFLADMNNWPDYVFNSRYQLPSLNAVKAYIEINHHLPDMPSASEVATSGLDLAETNKRLTQKVEELTLYMIEKDKQLSAIQKQLNTLSAQFSKRQRRHSK